MGVDGACIQAILAEGVAILDSISIHGPADQLELVKPGTEALGTKYYATDGGFSKYAYAAPARLDLVVAVQNCGNIGLAAIKSLVARGGCKVRTASATPTSSSPPSWPAWTWRCSRPATTRSSRA